MIEIETKERYLTQNRDVSIEERLFVKRVCGANVSEDDWREATDEEIEAHEALEMQLLSGEREVNDER